MYSITTASKATGVPIETLRAWERRYGLKAQRDAQGRRVYSEEDVLHIQRMREAVDRGHPIGRIATLSREALLELLSEEAHRIHLERLVAGFVREVLEAAETFQPYLCERALARASAILSPAQLVESVLGPTLREVGERWHREELSVAQERMVSSAVLRQLHMLLESYGGGLRVRPVVFATTSGERHELGLLMAAVFAASRGTKCLYLGADLPPQDLARFCARSDAAAVCCSFILGAEMQSNLHSLRASAPPALTILVGGAATQIMRREELPEKCVVTPDLRSFARELAKL